MECMGLKNMRNRLNGLNPLLLHRATVHGIVQAIVLFFGMHAFFACEPDVQWPVLPTIELLSASHGLDVQIPDTVSVRVRIRCDQALNRAILRVQRVDGIALLAPQVRALSGHDTILDWLIALTDSMLPSGQFQIVLQAVSGDQTVSFYLPLQLRAIPRNFKGVVWFTQVGGQTAIYRCDSMGLLAPREPLLNLDLVQGTSFAGSRKVWLRGRTSSVLWSCPLDSLVSVPIYSTASQPGFPLFTYLSSGEQSVYVSRGVGDVLCFSPLGVMGGQFSISSDFIPVFTCRQQEHLLIELRARPPFSIARARIYHADFQGLIREFAVPGNILGASRMSSDVWLLLIQQNNAAYGRLWRYSMSTQQLQEESPQSMDHRFVTMTKGRGGYWMGGNTGIWYFRPSSFAQNGIWQLRYPEVVTDLYYHDDLNRLVGWNHTLGYSWEPDRGGRIECQLPDSIRFAHPY